MNRKGRKAAAGVLISITFTLKGTKETLLRDQAVVVNSKTILLE